MKLRFLILFSLLVASDAAAQQIITTAEPTAAESRIPFYLVDVTDNETPETGLTFTTSECQWSENGASFANCTGTVTEVGNGLYYYAPASGEIDTTGFGVLKINDAAANVALATAFFRPFDLTVSQTDGL